LYKNTFYLFILVGILQT